jgi:pSer/pThr/pTyr-binding forkhead associated (FHA) protein
MDVKLVIMKGPSKGQTIRLRHEETVVGRQKGSDLRIPSATVSRRHCVLRFRDDCLTVEDLGSANGTFLNGARISQAEIVRPGDRLVIGPVMFTVDYTFTEPVMEPVIENEDVVEITEEFVEPLLVRTGEPDTVNVNNLGPVDPEVVDILPDPEEVVEGIVLTEETPPGQPRPPG